MKLFTHHIITAVLTCTSVLNAQNVNFKNINNKDLPSNPSVVWQQFGPGMSGNNKCAFWHPMDKDRLFISPNMGNSYVSTNAGHTYTTILNEDKSSVKNGERGPNSFGSIDFSRQDPNFGFCTDLKTKVLFATYNKGKNWLPHKIATNFFENSYLSVITVDPKNDNIWYIGAGRMRYLGRILFNKANPNGTFTNKNSQGKVWKTTDKGITWTLINKGINPSAEVENIIIDPINSNHIYASTNYGLYKSLDGGKSWKIKETGLDTNVIRSFKMHFDPKTNVKTFYVVASVLWDAKENSICHKAGGVFKSTDNCETWTNINGDLAMDMSHFKNNRLVLKSYYHTLAYYFGITDKEAKKRFPVLPKNIIQRFTQITIDPSDANNIYLVNMYTNASRNNFMPGAMWRSKNGGKHWYVTFRNGKNWNNGKDLDYWKKRNNPTGTNVKLLYLSDWINRDQYDRKSINFAKFNSDGSILHTQMAKISLMSYDKGDTWVDIDDVPTKTHESFIGAGNSNLPGHGFYQDHRFPNQVFCSAGENTLWVTNADTTPLRPNAQAATFHNLLNTEASLSCYAIHPKNKNTHYAMFFRQAFKGYLMKSIDGGKTWKKHGVAIPKWTIKAHSGDQSVHQLNLVFDKENTDIMYFNVPKSSKHINYVGNSVTGFGIHKSTDGGKTWKQINNGLPKKPNVTSIRVAPNNNYYLYATVQGNNGGLYISKNKGNNWTKVKSTKKIAGKFGINDIHFANNNKVYISSGYKTENATKGGLWVSDSNMKKWKCIFKHPWVFRVEVAKYNNNVILISTLPNNNNKGKNAGTYLTKDGGKTWIKINKGNGQSDRINDIAIDYTVPNKYYVSTYGSGFYVAK